MTKGFIDKVIFPGVAYDYDKSGRFPRMIKRFSRLNGITLITTMNTPSFFYRLVFGNAVKRALFAGTADSAARTPERTSDSLDMPFSSSAAITIALFAKASRLQRPRNPCQTEFPHWLLKMISSAAGSPDKIVHNILPA